MVIRLRMNEIRYNLRFRGLPLIVRQAERLKGKGKDVSTHHLT